MIGTRIIEKLTEGTGQELANKLVVAIRILHEKQVFLFSRTQNKFLEELFEFLGNEMENREIVRGILRKEISEGAGAHIGNATQFLDYSVDESQFRTKGLML
jgi:hypothetical protein